MIVILKNTQTNEQASDEGWRAWWTGEVPAGRPFFRRRAGWVALAALFFLVFYALHGDRITPDPASPARFDLLAGDEPHYLMLTHSLVTDGDLDLFNNMENRDYLLFYTGSVPDYKGGFLTFWRGIVRGRLKDKPYEYWTTHLFSICSPGLPVLLAPAYAVGHAAGGRVRYTVTVFIHALAAVLAALTVWIAWTAFRVRLWALLTGCFLALAGPLIFYSMSVYTDLPGALCIAGAFALLAAWPQATSARRVWTAFGLGFCLGFMVCLHTKFWFHFFYLLAFAAWVVARKGRPSRIEWAAFAAPLGLLVAGIAFYYWFVFGVPYPVRTYPPFSALVALTSGWPGLWLDQRHGLLWYAPVCILLWPGLVLLSRRRNTLGLWMGGLIVLHWLSTGLFSDWTGGRSPPMRYWVPVMPLFAAPIAACAWAARRSAWRFFVAALGWSGGAIGVFGMLHPRRLYAYAHSVFSYVPGASWYKRLAPLFDVGQPPRNLACAALALAAALAVCALFVWLGWKEDRNDA